MGTVNVVLGEDTRLNLILGQQLENAVTSVVFDFSAWQTTYGSGTLALSVQRPGDDQPYAVTLTTSGTDATWSVTNLDTAYKGVGHIQLTYTVGSAIKKSVVYKFTVYESLGANGEYPSPGQTWQEEMEQEITDVKSDLAELEGGGLSDDAKQALLACFENVAWIGDDGQDYYDALESALYPPADLVSISCVYTQSGTVYDTDTLDSLKDDLVVTAHMSDSTTQTVTTYTLSGTLTEGTSTITVSYGGKTTTFTVTVTQEPPYDFYDYIQGDGTAYINTGLLASTYCTNDYAQEIKVAGHTTESTKAVCGARQQWGSNNARGIWHTNATYSQTYCGKDSGYVMSGTSLDTPVIIKTTTDKKIYCDNTLIDTATGTVAITHTGTIPLFAECSSGQGSGYVAIPDTNAYAGAFSKSRIYYFKVWDSSDNLVSEMKPALRKSDNAIGMYDTVRDMFFENARDSGALSLGNE